MDCCWQNYLFFDESSHFYFVPLRQLIAPLSSFNVVNGNANAQHAAPRPQFNAINANAINAQHIAPHSLFNVMNANADNEHHVAPRPSYNVMNTVPRFCRCYQPIIGAPCFIFPACIHHSLLPNCGDY